MSDLLHDLLGPLQVGVAARPAAGADEHGDVAVHRRLEHKGEVAFGGVPAHESLAHTQVIRPRVGTAGVAGNQVRVFLQGALQGTLLEPVTNNGGRGDYPEFSLGHD